MPIAAMTEKATSALLSTRDLFRTGMTERKISAARLDGSLIRLRQGQYVPRKFWEEADSKQRQLTIAVAVQQYASDSLVFSHRTAATLLGLPLWSEWLGRLFPAETNAPIPHPVHLTTRSNRRASSNPLVFRHRSALREEDVTSTAGLVHTTWERTLFDIARSEPFGIALVCADEMLRQKVRIGRSIDKLAWEGWRERLLHMADRSPRTRGMQAVRALAKLAHPGADSPLETVSRLRSLQVGLEVELLARVPSPHAGHFYYLDLWFKSIGVFGECDGKAKYFDPNLRGNRTMEEVLYDEKRRHDWIVGKTGLRGIRWAAPNVETTESFSKMMREFNIQVPGVPVRSFGDDTAAFLRRLP